MGLYLQEWHIVTIKKNHTVGEESKQFLATLQKGTILKMAKYKLGYLKGTKKKKPHTAQ